MNTRFRDGIPPRQERNHHQRGQSFAPLCAIARPIFTKPRPLWRRVTLRGWTLLAGLAASTAFWGYIIWSIK